MPLNPEIVKAVVVTAELTGSALSEAGIEAMVEHLSGYPAPIVLKALHRCQLELRGGLTLGAVMDRLDDGHPGPETAWAMVGGLDEDASVVWTDEIAASYGLVRGLTDRVASRLAFVEDYRQRLAEARQQQRPPVWRASLGWDASRRAGVVREAVERGRLTVGQARAMLPEHEMPSARSLILPEGAASARALVQALTRQLMAEKRDPEPGHQQEETSP